MRILALMLTGVLLSVSPTGSGAAASGTDQPSKPAQVAVSDGEPTSGLRPGPRIVPQAPDALWMPHAEPIVPGPVPMPHAEPVEPGPVPMPEAQLEDPRTLVVPAPE